MRCREMGREEKEKKIKKKWWDPRLEGDLEGL
jgi:hypothetical protein